MIHAVRRPRVAVLIDRYPQLSETYMRSEILVLAEQHDVLVFTRKRPSHPYRRPQRYRRVADDDLLIEAVRDFGPDVIHAHWLTTAARVAKTARALGVPFTMRAHSFDLLRGSEAERQARLGSLAPLFCDPLCLGVLAFPFARASLERAGIVPEKIRECFPCVDVERFLDHSPNGDRVLNCGAALPKKSFGDFIELAARLPELDFDLYLVGYDEDEIAARNRAAGRPVRIRRTVQPDRMPAVYKRHRWLVYTACPKLGTTGWPMAIAEAQASGVGVCMRNLRPDLAEYVGPAGFLYDSLDEVAEILRRPFPEEMREQGFELARRADVRIHIRALTDLWRPVLPTHAHACAKLPPFSAYPSDR
jgi:hypothetical protein